MARNRMKLNVGSGSGGQDIGFEKPSGRKGNHSPQSHNGQKTDSLKLAATWLTSDACPNKDATKETGMRMGDILKVANGQMRAKPYQETAILGAYSKLNNEDGPS